jgi:SAM-dependent methyltransferase
MRGAPMSDEFRALELAAWQTVHAEYDEGFGGLTTQVVEPLLDAAQVREGVDVLDVASGPGYMAAAAARRGARVIGVDFSAAMVSLARARHAGIDFREGDAEALPFEDGRFDAVVMSFGVLHLARPEHAMAEAFRVLRSGGRFGFTVWAPPERAVAFGMVLRAVQTHGKADVPLPPGPPFFRYSDPVTAIAALRNIGFDQPSVIEVPQLWRLPSTDALFRIMSGATARTAALLRAQTPEALRAIAVALEHEASAWRRGSAVEMPMPAMLASGRRP